MQPGTADTRVGLVMRYTPAEKDASSVRRGAVVVDHLAGVADDAVLRHQSCHGLAGDRFGGDDIAADGDDAALQPWRRRIGIAVCGDDDFAGDDAASGAVDAKA